jgi:hypothetical protein
VEREGGYVRMEILFANLLSEVVFCHIGVHVSIIKNNTQNTFQNVKKESKEKYSCTSRHFIRAHIVSVNENSL